MVIPVGLLSETEKQQRRTRGPSADNYWLGDRYYAPRAQNPSYPSPQALQAAQAAVQAAQQVQQAAAVFPGLLHTGDGAQGEGFSGGRADPSPTSAPATSTNADVQASMNANVAPAAGIPSLPDFKEAQAAPTAPATTTNQDLAVSEVDPQGPSGAGRGSTASRGAGMNPSTAAEQAANQAAAQAQAEAQGLGRAAIDKAIQEQGFMGAVKGITSRGVDFGITPDTAENAAGARQERSNDLPSVSQNFADHPSVTGKGTGSGSGNTDGVGPGGMGMGGTSDGTAGTGTGTGTAGGEFRRGGSLRGNRNGRLEEVPIVAHEGEFVQKPEAVSYYGDDFMHALNERRIPRKKALGLLADLEAKPQAKSIDRGLLGI